MLIEAQRALGAVYTLTPRELGALGHIRRKGMTFSIRSYELAGVGRLCLLSMRAMLGLMTMETVILTPLEVDAPLLSCDRIRAMGRDTLLLELYDTQLTPLSPGTLDALDAVKARYAGLPGYTPEPRWYDSMKLSPTLAKRGKGGDYDALSDAYLAAYLALLAACPACPRREKQTRVGAYVDGLFSHGGPSTDQFRKLLGDEAARTLFARHIFASED